MRTSHPRSPAQSPRPPPTQLAPTSPARPSLAGTAAPAASAPRAATDAGPTPTRSSGHGASLPWRPCRLRWRRLRTAPAVRRVRSEGAHPPRRRRQRRRRAPAAESCAL
eukprot:357225-Chlamydomonas_euryale.AAC.4